MLLKRLGFLAVVALLLASGGCAQVEKRLAMAEGNKLYKAEKYEDAVAAYQKILDRNPYDWTAHWMIAVSYLALYHPGSTHPKDIEYCNKSIENFEKLLMLRPPSKEEQEKVRTYYVSMLISADKKEKALAYYELMLKKHPDDVEQIQKIADLYRKMGDFENALRYYEKVTQIRPNSKEGWYTIGAICFDQSNKRGMMMPLEARDQVVQKGIAALDKSLQIDPNYFEALAFINLIYREKAAVLHMQAKYDEAQAAMKTADEFRAKALEARKAKAGGAQPVGGQAGGA